MKNFFKSLMLVGLLACTNLFAETISTNLVGSGAFSLVTAPIHLLSLEIVNNHPTNAATVYFFDSSTTATNYVRGPYTNTLTYTTNIVVITTDYYGNNTTNTNAATWTIANAVAQATNSFRLFKTMSVAAGGTSSWIPAGGVYCGFGITAVASQTNVTVNASYSYLR